MTKGKRIEYFSRFLNDYFFIDKQPRKIKFVVPELCFFEKGVPVALISKRREIAQLRIIKNKEKLNAFEIENFFIDGYVFHNNYQSKLEKQDDGRFKNLSKDHFYNFRELLKTESLVLVKFKNDSCQMMNLTELDNLFKSKQRATRMDVVSVATMVSAVDCNETRVHINFNQLTKSPLLERAKN